MKSKKNCEITERDYKLLRFLWKWKIVSTRGLAQKFYPEADPFTAYRRLLYLEADGYIGNYPLGGMFNYAWILKERGFKYILPYLGDLRSKGYKSTNYPHDFLASAFHLGEWLTHQPDNSQTYSEQQLRCYPVDLWPSWVPTSTLHRPDGYSTFHNGKRQIVVAFEAELSVKAKPRYESVVTFYDGQTSIDYVFWLADSKITFNALRRCFQKFQMREWSKHQFVLESDFQGRGWGAKVIEGTLKGQSLLDLLMHNTHSIPTQNPRGRVTLSLLDSRKRPKILKP